MFLRCLLGFVIVGSSIGQAFAQTVILPDPILEGAVRLQLQKSTGAITVSDMQQLTSLNVDFQGVTNISGLEAAANMQSLSLGYNGITDMSPVAGLSKLTFLNASGNPFRGSFSWCGLTNLTDLWLYSTSLNSLERLRCLTNLTSLFIGQNNAHDFSPLLSLPHLNQLSVESNPCTNFTILAASTNVLYLSIGGPQQTNLSWIPSLTRLATLQLLFATNVNLAPLESLAASLTTLQMVQCSIQNLSVLPRMTNLISLGLSGPVNDLGILQELTNLTSLNLESVPLTNLNAVATLSNLHTFSASGEVLPDLSPLLGLKSLWSVSLYSCLLDISAGSPTSHVIDQLEANGTYVNYPPPSPPVLLIPGTLWCATAESSFVTLLTYVGAPQMRPTFTAKISDTNLLPGVEFRQIHDGGFYNLVLAPPHGTGNATITVLVDYGLGNSNSANLMVTVTNGSYIDGHSIGGSNIVWRSQAGHPWIISATSGHAASSKVTSAGDNSWLEAAVTGPGTFSFWTSADTIGLGGHLSAMGSGGQIVSAWLNGGSNWQRTALAIPAGTWRLRWDAVSDFWDATQTNSLSVSDAVFVPGEPGSWMEFDPFTMLGEVNFVINGKPGSTYTVEASSDLRNWDTQQTFFLENFAFPFSDQLWDAPQRFYRMKTWEIKSL
jgi:hypothetical protein